MAGVAATVADLSISVVPKKVETWTKGGIEEDGTKPGLLKPDTIWNWRVVLAGHIGF